MGAEQSSNTATNDLTDWQGEAARSRKVRSPPSAQLQLLPHDPTSPVVVHPCLLTPNTPSTPSAIVATSTIVESSTAQLETVTSADDAIISVPPPISASTATSASEPTNTTYQPFPAQPYLPHAQATLLYLDSLLSRAEATRDLHRANVVLVAEQLKMIQEERREKMEQEARQKVEEQQMQTEMKTSDDDDDAEKDTDSEGERLAKRARRQLIDDTQSLYMKELQHEHSSSSPSSAPSSLDDLPPPTPSQVHGMSDELFAIVNPLNMYATDPEALNDTGLISGATESAAAPIKTQQDISDDLFVNELMADLEEVHRGQEVSTSRASSVVPSSSASVASDANSSISTVDSNLPGWSKSSYQLRKVSEKFKANFQKIDALAVLERAHQGGLISLDVLTQYLAFIQMVLDQQDHDSLMQAFNAMHVQEKAPTSIALASSQIPQWVDDLIPEEAAPDDPDGVARMRLLLRYSTSADETYQQIQEVKKRRSDRAAGSGGRKQKRKQSVDDDNDDDEHNNLMTISIKPIQSSTELPEIGSSFSAAAASSISSSPSASSSSSTSSTATIPSTPIHQVAYRISWLNAAFERIFGYTQHQAKQEFDSIGERIIYMFVRSDHIQPFHFLLTKMKLEGKCEIHMYQVRMTKDGREIYCLVHIRINSIKGKMMDGCQSIIPLPDEAQKDMPPFQEGVDLHEDVLLYGYKRPSY